MQLGRLTFSPIGDNPALVAQPVQRQLKQSAFQDGVFVSAIDASLADTAAFCEAYNIAPEVGANCIIVEAKRANKTWYAACIILASDRIDVNGKIRRYLDARKISFAPKDTALRLTDMEYGGITPIGLPDDLPILIDEKVLTQEYVIIGSGLRRSKILVRTNILAALAKAKVIDMTK